jgi:hypothetical protein
MSGVERMRIVTAQIRRVVRKPYFSRRALRRKGTMSPAGLVPALMFVRCG